MKKREYSGRINHLSENEYYRRLSEISHKCRKDEIFEFEGRYFSGSIVGTIKAYLQQNPEKSFFEWLIDNELEVKQF